ncbi:MAG TPA: amino acid adenylation domain-containing protein, partial [Tahibacter sp.]|uniref:amino acid adenylation domain-containing protein n=1 Tax=Tahibacter sp. TaxID=2056211 RepID=UPI002C30BB9E
PVHGLPLSRARPPQQQFRGGMHQARLPAALVARLRAHCAAADMTPYVFLQLVFALLIARYGNASGADGHDVVVGTPVSGRMHPDVEPLVGFFVNTLVLRTRIDPRQSFADLLAASRQSVLDAFSHQALPFEMLVDALRPERSLSYSPLFQILFSYHNAGQGELRLPGLTVAAPPQADTINQFDIEFNVADEGDTLQTVWSYNRTLFDADAIARLSDSFGVLLQAALDAPRTPVGELPLIAPAEAQRLRESGRGERVAFRDDIGVHALFEEQAVRTPDAAAVVGADETVGYAELNARANRLAHYLIERGAKPGARVGICLRRSPEMTVALLGVLKAGAAYVPLSPDAPSDRQAYLLDDAGIELVLTHSEFWGALPLDDREALPLDLSDRLLADYPATNPGDAATGLTAGDACYVIYTSGSTGQPKGVVVPHRGVVNYLEFAARDYLDADIAGALVATPFGFDATVTTLMAPWLAGKPSVMLADDTAECLAQLLDYAASPQRWLFKLTPAHLDAMANLYKGTASQTPHVLVVGGEQLTRRTLQRFRAQVLPQSVVINEYGPTETVVGCSVQRCEPGDAVAGDAVPIGRPIANTRLLVLDAAGQPVPVGVAGELYIAGAGVTLGYLGRGELTAQKFPADPQVAGERCYRSGDLVRWLADGSLEFVGRTDDQVKVNGFRIELGEIESALAAHADVAECCVAVRADGEGRGRLVAYVVPRASILESADDESEIQRWKFERIGALREFARGRLPEYLQPSVYVLLDAMPLSANNKLDRGALPAPDENDFEKETYVAPRDAQETALVDIWQDVLGLARIGIDDHFFRLGGHSLLATRVVSEIAERLQRRVPVRALFEHPTVRALSARIAEESEAAAAPIARAPAGVPALSFAQQRLWFIDQLEGGSRQYHIAAALRLDGDLDATALRRALDTIVQRHEVLRTRFVPVDGAATLQLAADGRAGFATSDLSAADAATQDEQLRALIAQETAVPFDLAHDTLLRCRLIRLGDARHVAVLTMHHIASDGWSTALLVREFGAIYAALRENRANPLLPLALQYSDFAHWQRTQLQGERLQRHLDFWREQLRDLPRVHALPLDRARPAQQRFSGGRIVHDIPAPLTQSLRALAQRHDASLFMLLQSAFALLIGRWSGETDVVMGSPVAGRVAREVEPLIGFFINNLVLRTDLSGDPCFGELLARSRERILDASAHQLLPFDMLVDALKPERSLNHAPLFQISFSFHNLEQTELRLPGLAITHLASGGDIARFDIELHISEIDDGLHVRWLYADSLFDAATIARFAESFATLLSSIVDAPTQSVQSLPLLPAAD